MKRFISPISILFALAACDGGTQAPAPDETLEAGTASAIPPPADLAPEPTPSPAPPPAVTPSPVMTADRPPALAPAAEKGDKGARSILLYWARSLELGEYDTAFAQWGAAAEVRSGMARAEHAAWWRRFKTITVAMPSGTMEGAAGSSYYTAPTTVVGKTQDGRPYRLEGEVVLKRVNDVPGATADQLRWHIEQVDLKPV